MTGYLVEVTQYALEQGIIERSLHGSWGGGERQPLPYVRAARFARTLNEAQAGMLAKGRRSHVLRAAVVVA